MTGEILFLAHRVPFPPDRGDKIRSWNILKKLCELAPVHVCAIRDPADPADVGATEIGAIAASLNVFDADHGRLGAMAMALLSGASASIKAFGSSAMLTHIENLTRNRHITATYAFSGQMAQFAPDGPRFIMDFVDMDSAKFATYADQKRGLAAFAHRMEAKRLFAVERAVAQLADLSLFVSDAEAGLFRRETGLGTDKVQALENGIDLERFNPSHGGRAQAGQGALIVFTGQMDYPPNIEAVVCFVREQLPVIRTARPDTLFAIVGRAPTAEVRALAARPGVIVTGEVADTRDWLMAADVVVAPLKLARGIQNKVLEAMAMARPVVASSPAAEGIDAVDCRDFIVSDTPQTVVDLLANPAKASALGKAARARMEARYGWDAQLARLPEIMGLAA